MTELFERLALIVTQMREGIFGLLEGEAGDRMFSEGASMSRRSGRLSYKDVMVEEQKREDAGMEEDVETSSRASGETTSTKRKKKRKKKEDEGEGAGEEAPANPDVMGGAGDPAHRHHHHFRRKQKTQAEAAEGRSAESIGCQSHESASIMGFCKKCCNYACEECYESGEHV